MVIKDIKVPQTIEGKIERIQEHTLIISKAMNAVKAITIKGGK